MTEYTHQELTETGTSDWVAFVCLIYLSDGYSRSHLAGFGVKILRFSCLLYHIVAMSSGASIVS